MERKNYYLRANELRYSSLHEIIAMMVCLRDWLK